MNINHSPDIEMPSPGKLGEEKLQGGVMERVRGYLDAYARGERVRTINNINPDDYETQEELFEAIKYWWIHKYRKKESTIIQRLRDARRMARHPIFPIDFKKFDPNQIIAYLEYREKELGEKGKHQIKNEWKVIKTFARAYGLNIDNWGYYPPNPPPAKVKIIPLPPMVHKILHTKYSKDRYLNALIQHVLTHGFTIGWRPSEAVIQKVSKVFPEEGYIIIEEAKKYGQQRQIFLERDVLSAEKRKSLKVWIDHWRPKVENQYSGNALYLWPSGRPVTVRKLGQKLSKHGKKVWRHFQPYDMRHWCAVARLIKTKIETGNFDIYTVRNWLGHERITTTENYVRYAEQYYNQLPIDWIAAALRPSLMMAGKSGGKGDRKVYIDLYKESEINRTRFLGLLTDFSPYKLDGPDGI